MNNDLILIVEDEREIAEIIRSYLERGGFRTVTASDGALALSHFHHLKPALVLLDVKIPVIVQETPLQVWNYPENKELWDKVAKLEIPRTEDAHENFKSQVLGGLQMLYKSGELGLELLDYEMKAGKDVWGMAHPVTA